MGIFTRKPTQNTTGQTPIANNDISKKNTYTIALSGAMVNTSYFCLCKATPLAVVELNGKPTQNTTGFLSCTEFPNPFASEMQSVYKQMAVFDKIVGSGANGDRHHYPAVNVPEMCQSEFAEERHIHS